MEWQESLTSTASDPDLAQRLIAAVGTLLDRDVDLLRINAGERAVSHRLAVYLESLFPGWHVDCEYNRDGFDPKEIPGGSGDDADEGSRVLPDIIVHRRMSGQNLLVLELKKSSNRERDDVDIAKLSAYKRVLGYGHAAFIRFEVGESSRVMRAMFV